MKIGIITFHSSHNYGAFLQAYALREVVEKYTGAQVEIINFIMAISHAKNQELAEKNADDPVLSKAYRQLFTTFEESIRRYQTLSKEPLISDDLDEINRYIADQGYDLIIAGSDEIWKTHSYRGFPNAYFLTDPNAKYVKISYAVSCRTPLFRFTPEMKELVASYLAPFDYIGVRDEPTFEGLSYCCGSSDKMHYNCDPTFLYDFKADAERGRAILRDKFHLAEDGRKRIALMCESEPLAKEVLRVADDGVVFVPLYRFYPEIGCPYVPDPFEWIDIIAACDGMITTFFHGTVFSMKNNVPFCSFEKRNVEDNKASKIYDVLNRHGLAEHFGRLNDPELDVGARVRRFLDSVKAGTAPNDFSAACKAEGGRSQSFFDVLDGWKK